MCVCARARARVHVSMSVSTSVSVCVRACVRGVRAHAREREILQGVVQDLNAIRRRLDGFPSAPSIIQSSAGHLPGADRPEPLPLPKVPATLIRSELRGRLTARNRMTYDLAKSTQGIAPLVNA